ncbi:MAG: glutamyl-tRNA amidotransferase [Candidatus Pelagibacter sp. TMED64]|mgnify:FL=1|nr:glutamyl-tRNA amidotransferase [Candidatus Pelagibacter sp.]OUU65899.1 MAG: glutamyl-tRNA amidotransferase [Candidatus Pelagibacter sp. TMED64]|tara:strand:+ start:48 stop:512 length:465 start_codon:yes stop_codon:yes gene_type:complete
MPQREKITEKYNNALKSKDKMLISTFRLILSSIKDGDIAKRTGGKKELLNDQEIDQILRKMLKQRNESADIYKKANRTELLDNELKEITIIEEFLPKLLNAEDTKKICKDLVLNNKASGLKDMGKIMGLLKKDHSSSVDFSIAGKILKDLLNNK